jgi:hypothetical protein
MSSVAKGITAQSPIDQPKRSPQNMNQQPTEWLNPNVGWVIGPIAMATTYVEKQLAVVDLSWAELLYSVAAVIYASAALVKSLKERRQSGRDQKSVFTTKTTDVQDTVDIK